MVRVKYAPASRHRKKRLLKKAEGYWGARSRWYKKAHETLHRALVYAYRDRRTKKRFFRSLWIVRINAAAKAAGISYSKFISGLKKAKVALDRKALADIAVNDKAAFNELVKIAKKA